MERLVTWRKALAYGLALIIASANWAGVQPRVALAISNDIVISQVYGGGGNDGAQYTNDFIVLFNRGTTPVNISGWSVQYASSASTSWQVTGLSNVSVQPGKSYLIQQAAGATPAATLPLPDATGTVPMSASAGKIALVTNATALTCGVPLGSCSAAAGVKDLVGYGSATDSETAPAPALSSSTAGFRAANGCTDTDNNASDFSTAVPAPKNSTSAATPCGPPPVIPVCPPTLNTSVGTATAAALTASDSDGIVISASITSTPVAGITLDSVVPASAVGGSLSATLNVASSVAIGTYGVVVTFTNNGETPQTATCTITVNVQVLTTTPAIQGSGSASPLVGQIVTTRGVVTRLYPDGGTVNSLFIQDGGDGNLATSDGLFIFNGAAIPAGIAVGDVVEVKGTVTEFNGLTELATVTVLKEISVGTAVTPITLSLPVASDDGLEAFENMLVTIPQTLTVSQNYFQGRYGQLTLSAGGRLLQPTNIFRPNTPEAIAENTNNVRRTLVLDDGRTSQNPNPIPYIGADNTNRAGDTVAGLTGVLDFGPINSNSPATRFYRLQPTVPLASISFTRTNPRGKPENVGGNLKVASANVLNYFTTLDATGNTCYTSTGPADCRGANTAGEFTRQRTKIISELLTLDADVFGLMEVENNGPTAVGDLVAGLNAIAGAGTYAIVPDPTNDPVADTTRLGGDAIKVAMIYKPSRVMLQGQALSSSDSVFSRAPFAQTFTLNSTGLVFSVIVNHFKSKGSCPSNASDANADTGDGQSCWNALRVQQSQALLTLIATVKAAAGSDDLLVIGDLNSYGQEDPIKTLTDGGLINQLAKRSTNPYSYVFDGLAGYLDHALTTASLDAKVTGITEWHNNADETSVIDYNTEFKPQDLYTEAPYRASDHDPILIGLNLGGSVLSPDGKRLYLPLAVR